MADTPEQSTYREVVAQMWATGRLTAEDVATLTSMQRQLGLDAAQAHAIETEVMGQTRERALVAGVRTGTGFGPTPVPRTTPAPAGTATPPSTPLPRSATPTPTPAPAAPTPAPMGATLSGGRTGFGAQSLDAGVGGAGLRAGDVVAGRFEVLEVLGQGGMGQVLKVRDTKLNALRAMKVIHPHLTQREDLAERFRNEVITCQKLSHPNIVRIYDYDEDAARGLRLFTMELMQGVTLRKWLTDKQRTGQAATLEEFRFIADGVCNGLEHAHKVTIHRDLKPENIMIDLTTQTIKLMDFGIAKVFDISNRYVTASAMGTPHYMAPEQETGAAVDQRADIYSAGVIFYEILAGTIPRAGSKPLSMVRPDVPAAMSQAISRAMAPSPFERFASVAELKRALAGADTYPNRGPAPTHSGVAQSIAQASASIGQVWHDAVRGLGGHSGPTPPPPPTPVGLPPMAGGPSQPPHSLWYASVRAPGYSVEKFKATYRGYMICAATSVMLVAGMPMGMFGGSAIYDTLGPLLMLCMVGAGITQCVLLYRYWNLIQDGYHRCTPGMAVGLIFVPFFNYYWCFQAIHGLAQDMNRYCHERGINSPPINPNLTLGLCILVCCSLLGFANPWLAIVMMVGLTCYAVVVWKSLNECAMAIVSARGSA